MNKLLILIIVSSISLPALAFELIHKDARQKEAEYIHKILKEEEKEKYERKMLDYNPSGYMTTEEYESLSRYKDKSTENYEIPNQVRNSDMKYVPKPTYSITRYNEPPGSAELNISKKLYKLGQYNGQGITAPDFSIMVYPVVYYYPNSASTASDLFVIPLENDGTPLHKIMRANIAKRLPEPIYSTEKSIDNLSAFRSLTPVDFSADSTKLLFKEKIGSSYDGIWKTNAIVYDFDTRNSYNLVELRDAIIYYWKEHKNINLDDLRWDIYPLGFLKSEPNRIAACAYAYTGNLPIFLGVWSIDVHGEQSRLISFDLDSVELSLNGYKIVQDGVVKPVVIENEEKAQKYQEKLDMKNSKAKQKAHFKNMKREYKAKIKEMNDEFNAAKKDFNMYQSISGSTVLNEIPAKYKELQIKKLNKEIKKYEKLIEKDIKYINNLNKKLEKK